MPDDLVIRPLEAGETELFLSYPHPPVPDVGPETSKRGYRGILAAGEYRPGRTWVALRDGAVVARAAWWSGPRDEHPATLDWLDCAGDPSLGARLLTVAHETMRTETGELPEYHLFLPPAWRDVPAARALAEEKLAAARLAGLTRTVERLNYFWRPAAGVPEQSRRLEFRPAGDDATVVDALRRVLVGTLDAASQREVARHGLDQAAVIGLEDLAWYPAPRDWWRLAYDKAGELVGIIVPTRNYVLPVVGYVGVVPEQRGRGYADDLLGYATRVLADQPDGLIGADTDLGNHPMAASFARAGYEIVRTRMVLTAP